MEEKSNKLDIDWWEALIIFVNECDQKNKELGLDPHHIEMEWNHTLPQCLFGDQPCGQWLTLRQHAIASCLQTIALRKICFCGWHNKFVPKWLWEKCKEVTKKERQEWARKAGDEANSQGVGCSCASSETLSEWGRKGGAIVGARMKKDKTGIFAPGMQQLGGQTTFELGVGLFAQSTEQLKECGRKTTSQRWECLVTGHISTPGGLARFQKARNIDTSLRRRLR